MSTHESPCGPQPPPELPVTETSERDGVPEFGNKRAPEVGGDRNRGGKIVGGILAVAGILTALWFLVDYGFTKQIKGAGGIRSLVSGTDPETESKRTIDWELQNDEDASPVTITPPRPTRLPTLSGRAREAVVRKPPTHRGGDRDRRAALQLAEAAAQRAHELELARIQADRDRDIAAAQAMANRDSSLEQAKAQREAAADERSRKAEKAALEAKMARRMVAVMTAARFSDVEAREGDGGGGDSEAVAANRHTVGGSGARGRADTLKVATVRPQARDADPCVLGRAGQPLQIRYDTAINTDVAPAVVVAYTREDFRAGPGCPVLIPRDTPFLGSLNVRVARGQKRLEIIYHTAQLPGQVPWDLPMSSPATGLLGEGGQASEGDEFNEWVSRFGNALLLNAIGVFVAEVAGGDDDRTRNAAADAFSESARDTLKEDSKIKRKRYVDHGDLGTIVLAQDVDFSAMLGEGAE